MKVQWSDWKNSYELELFSADSAVEFLQKLRLELKMPAMVEFFNPASGRSICVGVGRDVSVVTYQDSNDPPYYISAGCEEGDGAVVFCYGNEDTEYLLVNAISFELASLAVADFFRTNRRFEGIEWEKL